MNHKTVIEQVTGWKLNDHAATDDRLGRMIDVFGEDEAKSTAFQVRTGQQIMTAYELPTDIARYDTTRFNVSHQRDHQDQGILQFGHRKDHRPDLLQDTQGLGTVDPSGIPLMTETVSGEKADDRCYLPAWRRMVKTVGRSDGLLIADCQAASAETRATIAHEGGYDLFPLPMTGDIPAILRASVRNPPEKPQEIILNPKAGEEDDGPRNVGVGCVTAALTETMTEDGIPHQWQARRMFARSDAQAQRQKKGIKARLTPAEKKLSGLTPKKNDTADPFLKRAESILKDDNVTERITLTVHEAVQQKKKYSGRGRPGTDTPYKMIEIRECTRSFQQNDDAISECLTLAGWRRYVTKTPSEKRSLNERTPSYRNEWSVERGCHRFKNGCLPAVPLFVRLPDRMKGLRMLLMIAWQVLTRIEDVSRRALENQHETGAGLVPGHPKMKTARPTAERFLSRMTGIHLLITETDTDIQGIVIEKLHSLQYQILLWLNIPIHLYDMNFSIKKSKIQHETIER